MLCRLIGGSTEFISVFGQKPIYLQPMNRKRFFIITLLLYGIQAMAITINYKVQISDPGTHYALVQMQISGIKSASLTLQMPVWTPGSYMVREFERNVDNFGAESAGKQLPVNKVSKSAWKIENTSGIRELNVSYRIYCFENTVRTSYIDKDHAFLLPSSLLMYADAPQQGLLTLEYPAVWTSLSGSLPQAAPDKFTYNSYDELADAPFEIGTHPEIAYTVAGVKHKVAMVGRNNAVPEQLGTDLEKICSTMFNIIGEHPCKSYLFIVHHVDEGGGGLEHANSSVVQMSRFAYSNRERYLSFLSLMAHEYFHLWNVKRIRPYALGPFDYSRENYTNLLWVAEGITSYYDELAMYRAGFRSQNEYLKTLAGSIGATLNRRGAEVQSLHQASFDAWIKEYRPNENSINSSISYYLKGTVVAAALDIELLSATNGKSGLDQLMQYLYTTYYLKSERGFTDDEFYAAIDAVAGKKMNFRQWCETPNHAGTVGQLAEVMKKAGCTLSNKPQDNPWYTGISTETKGEKLLVKSVEALSPAYGADIQAGDELLAVNQIRVKNSLEDLLKLTEKGAAAELLICRAGLIRTVIISPAQSSKMDISLQISEKEHPVLKAWLRM